MYANGRFSSNVVEKCIRVADSEVRKNLVGEVLNRSRLEKLLRDSYGNYVIQTILDYCDPAQRMIVSQHIQSIGVTLTSSSSSASDLSFLLSETRPTESGSSPSSPVKTPHSVTAVDTRVEAEAVVVVDEVDSEMIEVEEVDTTDTLDDLSFNTSTP
jgi:hypothetical protein